MEADEAIPIYYHPRFRSTIGGVGPATRGIRVRPPRKPCPGRVEISPSLRPGSQFLPDIFILVFYFHFSKTTNHTRGNRPTTKETNKNPSDPIPS